MYNEGENELGDGVDRFVRDVPAEVKDLES